MTTAWEINDSHSIPERFRDQNFGVAITVLEISGWKTVIGPIGPFHKIGSQNRINIYEIFLHSKRKKSLLNILYGTEPAVKRTTMRRLHRRTLNPLSGNRKVPHDIILSRGTETDSILIKRKRNVRGLSKQEQICLAASAEGFIYDAIRKTSVNVSFFGHFYAMAGGEGLFLRSD